MEDYQRNQLESLEKQNKLLAEELRYYSLLCNGFFGALTALFFVLFLLGIMAAQWWLTKAFMNSNNSDKIQLAILLITILGLAVTFVRFLIKNFSSPEKMYLNYLKEKRKNDNIKQGN